MKMPTAFILLLAGLFVFAVAVNVRADVLSWDLPTQYENNSPLPTSDITSISIYKNGVLEVTLPGAPTSTNIPGACRADIVWTATATTANGLTSAQSDPVTQPIDEVGCAPKKPSGLRFSQ